MVTSSTLARFTLAAACLLFGNSLSAGAEPEPATSAWNMLRYEASGMLGSTNTGVKLLESSPRELLTATPKPLLGVTLQQDPRHVLVMDIQATGKALGKKHQSSVRIWFDAASGAVFLRDKLRSGKDPYRKVYRFADNGAFRIKQQPSSGDEARKPAQQWNKIKNSTYSYDLDDSGCDTVTDPALLLYLLSVRQAVPPSPRCVFFDDTLYKVSFIDQGREQIAVSYSDQTDSNNARDVDGSRTVRHYRLEVTPLQSGAESGDFELFELRGDIIVTLDLETGIPLQLAGHRSGVGHITIPVAELQRRTVIAGPGSP